MQTLCRNLLITTLCVAVSMFMFADVSHANGSGPVSKVKVHVRAELEPFNGSPEPDADGDVRHHKEARTKDGVTKIKKDEFKGLVKIQIDPASLLGIVNEDAAENADVRVVLSRNGIPYAECLLEFVEADDDDDEDEDEDEGVQAHYRIHVRIKKGAVKEKTGMCILADSSHAVPDALAGDVATATANGVAFLQGAFEKP